VVVMIAVAVKVVAVVAASPAVPTITLFGTMNG
jgi:hypothetical protein